MDIKTVLNTHQTPNKAVIIACDFKDEKDLFNFLKLFEKEKLFLKLGMQIVYSAGFQIINKLNKLGHHIFLDLKLHDISNTVENTISSLNNYQFDFLTIHGSGGKEMIQKAVTAVNNNAKIFSVTVLTSFSREDFNDTYRNKISILDYSESILKNTLDAKGTGIICSVGEATILKSKYPNAIFICPGIRSANANNKDDQKRVFTTTDAKRAKVDYIVVGRPITKSKNPYLVYHLYKKEFVGD